MLVIDGVRIIINSVYEKELRKEIFEKITFILTLIKGTIPMNREIGLDADILDLHMYEAQNKYTVSALHPIIQHLFPKWNTVSQKNSLPMEYSINRLPLYAVRLRSHKTCRLP